ncbi:MAG: hypothetical protein RIT81_31930 [Deltaproteobacteria bacterium]
MARGVSLAATAQLQRLGRGLVLQLHMVLRTMRIHDPTNKALLVASESLKDTINTLWAALDGEVRLQFVESVIYLNDMRLRMDPSTTKQVKTLQAEFEARGLGGLAFSRPVDSAALRDFLVVFSRPVENEADVKELRRKLEEFRDLALELLDPRHFADGNEEEKALRIDRKTFALQTYAKTIVCIREFVAALRDGRDPLAGKMHITRIVQDLVDVATERVNFSLKLATIKQANEYAYNHAANTCVLSIVLGRALEIDRLALVDLGTAAMFADIGFAMLPNELTERGGELTEAERNEVRDAMVRQIRAIIGAGAVNEAMMRRVIVAYEHHRPYYDPETQVYGQKHVFSRIVAVADAFDALTTRRPWREGFTADEALKILMQESGTKYDPLVVKVLVNLMGMYPLGSVVRLASGEIGVVYHNSNDPDLFEKPWIKIVRNASGDKVRRTIIRNLAEVDGPESKIESMLGSEALDGVDPGMAIVI